MKRNESELIRWGHRRRKPTKIDTKNPAFFGMIFSAVFNSRSDLISPPPGGKRNEARMGFFILWNFTRDRWVLSWKRTPLAGVRGRVRDDTGLRQATVVCFPSVDFAFLFIWTARVIAVDYVDYRQVPAADDAIVLWGMDLKIDYGKSLTQIPPPLPSHPTFKNIIHSISLFCMHSQHV